MNNFQPLGDNTYRVSGMQRSAITGRYVTKNNTPKKFPYWNGTRYVSRQEYEIATRIVNRGMPKSMWQRIKDWFTR